MKLLSYLFFGDDKGFTTKCDNCGSLYIMHPKEIGIKKCKCGKILQKKVR